MMDSLKMGRNEMSRQSSCCVAVKEGNLRFRQLKQTFFSSSDANDMVDV